MIKVSPDGKEKQVYSLHLDNDKRNKIRSGSMFILNSPLGSCYPPGKLEICLDPPVWVNKPGQNVLKDKPSGVEKNTTSTYKTNEDDMSDNKGKVVVVEAGTKMSPDPEIIVVDSVKSMDEFERDTSVGSGHAALNIYLEIVTIIMLFANMILP